VESPLTVEAAEEAEEGVEEVWRAEDTTPNDVEAALRELLRQRHMREDIVAARVLNLVVVVDRDWRGEIENRLERLGRYRPSRTVLCAVEPGRTTLDAWAAMTPDHESGPEPLFREQVELKVGPHHIPHLDTIVDPLVLTDVPTLVWSPHGHSEAVDSLARLGQVVLIDSVAEPDARAAVERARELTEHAYVVDLAWLRTTPWRERIAASFDPPEWRRELAAINRVTVRYRPDSGASAFLLLGWLSSRLGWKPGSMAGREGSLSCHATARRQDVTMNVEPTPSQSAPGLAGMTIETASGISLSLDRAPGGLAAVRRDRHGNESKWTLTGASRGEAGILGEGIRQALLRDPTYRPALDAAGVMLN